MRVRLSLRSMVEAIAGAVRRFPMAVAFLAIFIGSVILSIHCDETIVGKNLFFLLWWPGTAAMLNIVLRLWYEASDGFWREGEAGERQVSGKYGRSIVWVANALWLGVAALFRMHCPDSLAWNNASATLAVALAAGIILVPFLRRGSDSDTGFWNYALDTVTSALTSFAIGVLLAIGIDILLFAVEALFGVDVDWKIYLDIAWTCILFIGSLVFLQLIPRSENTGAERPGKTGLALVHYILMPLLAAYLITLYIYAAKILLSCELPRGGVSWLVSVSMLCLVLVVFFVYPVQFRATKSRLDRRILRWLPAVFLPLLLLMSIGIVRRISDYGITVVRLYLVLFNAWCYLVCIGLIVCKSRRIKWIPLSFIVLLLLASVGPQNFTSVTRRTLLRQIRREVNAGFPGVVFPLDSVAYDSLMTSGDSAFVSAVDSRMEYVSGNFPAESYTLVDSSFSERWRFGLYANEVVVDTVAVDSARIWSVYPENTDIQPIPDGYSRLIPELRIEKSVPVSDTLYLNVTPDSLRIAIPMAPLRKASTSQSVGCYPVYGDGVILYPSDVCVSMAGDNRYLVTISAVAIVK